MMKRKFVIDTDTASDDAVALLMALRHPDVEVVAITVVSGNVPVEQGTRNALYTVELSGAECPVYRGADRPLVREAVYAQFFHGPDGLGGGDYPAPGREVEREHAVSALIRVIGDNPGIVLVTLGPLTNVALALRQAPDLAGNVSRCVVMGGAACTIGNVTPAAEYNVWVDPEAARAVFQSGLPIEMVGWELCRGEANLSFEEMEHVLSLGTPQARFAIECNRTAVEANHRQSGDRGMALPDPVAMAIALDPAICTKKSPHRVQVETQSDLTRGMTVVDAFDIAEDERNRATWSPLSSRGPNATVCWSIDIAGWKRLLYRLLA